jgi:four helix bundle protein
MKDEIQNEAAHDYSTRGSSPMSESTDRELVDLRTRTKQFALRVIRVFNALPQGPLTWVIGKQLLKSGTSVGAHYRESCRSRSDAEIISKWEGALQELDETAYWLELVVESGLMSEKLLADLMREGDELIAILTTCVKKVKGR